MDELTMLKDLGRELYAAAPEPKRETRQRLTAAAAEEGRRFFRPRQLLVPVVAALLVGVLAVAVTVLVQPGRSRAGGPAAGSVASTQTRRELLAALHRPGPPEEPVPDPSAFLYLRELNTRWVSTQVDGKPVMKPVTSNYESWWSVDGTRSSGSQIPDAGPGLQKIPGCRNGRPKLKNADDDRMIPCQTHPAYRAKFPTTVAGARQSLYYDLSGSVAKGRRSNSDAFETGIGWLNSNSMPVASRGALLEAILGIPGVVVVPGRVTVDGATGVAVRWQFGKAPRMEYLINPGQRAIVGSRFVRVQGIPLGAKEPVVATSAILQRAVVARLGLRPDGTALAGSPASKNKIS
jgi:hypothetical protein